MKKIKKNKKQIQKGKWSIGKTIASVIGAISVVSGSTVLGVYLTGGFEQKVVRPESIAFDYDANIYRNGQLEISGVEKFSLTITTPTEDVTMDKVTLEFGKDVAYTQTPSYISNGVIQVPREVSLGEAFEVKVVYDGDEKYDDLIKNGSILYAKSENNMIDGKSLKIAVDAPVQRIENHITDLSGNVITTVGAGQEFKIATTFYPAVSRYMYGDTSREKIVLYSVASGSDYVEQTYDDNFGVTFKAGTQIVDNIKINAYAFKNAKSQEGALATLSAEDNKETRYDNLYSQLTGGENVSNTGISVTMASASISSFEVAKNDSEISITEGEVATIRVNSNDGISLGAVVKSTDDQILTYMLENVALEFVHANGQPFQESEIGTSQALQIGGRKLEEKIDGHILFLPYNDPVNINNYYYDITSTLSQDIKVNVYLVVTEASGKTLFKVGDSVQVKSFTLKTKSAVTETPTFVGQDEVNLTVPQETITLNVQNNKIVSQTINLKDYITNKTQSVQFYVRATEESVVDIIEGPFNGEVGGWTKLMENTITIIGAGSFEVKFETVKADGSVIQTCEAIKTFVCQQALSEGSIDTSKTTVTITQANQEVTTGEAYLAPVDDDKIEISFTFASASSSAFASEFKDGKISLSIYGKKNGEVEEDITRYFSITSSPENPTETLTYTLKIKNAPDADREITRIILKYKKDSTGENDIDWTVTLPFTIQAEEGEAETGASVIIYSPKTESISIADVPTNVSYTQTLEANGLKTSITGVGETALENVQALILAITGDNGENIVITDQKGREDTLAGKWKFVVEEGAGVLNLEKQTFNVKSTGTIKLKIQADDLDKFALIGDETYVLTINSSARGIDHLSYQNDKKVAENTMISSDALSAVAVEKYGVKDTIFTLADLVRYYLSEDESEENSQYTTISYKFASGYFETLTDEQIIDLFGENGMLSILLKDEDDFSNLAGLTVGEIKLAFENKEIVSIKVNNNFGKKCELSLEVTDLNSTFNTAFTFNLLSNIVTSEANYNNIYCEVETDLINVISYNENPTSETWPTSLAEIYAGQTMYIVEGENNGYRVTNEGTDGYVASITNGKITFVDFFDEENIEFQISFNDTNSYRFNLTNKFSVLRNIEILSTGNNFYAYSNINANISNYFNIKRISGSTPISANFSFITSNYLEVSGEEFAIKNNVKFGYNEQNLIENVTVRYNGTKIGEGQVKIEFALNMAKSLYEIIADLFVNNKPTVQKINGINYIVIDSNDGANSMWTIGDRLVNQPIEMDRNVDAYVKQGSNSFKLNAQSKTLAGLNDQKYYLAFKVSNNGRNVIINVPLIISKVGNSPVNYESGVASDKKLAMAIMTATELAESGKTFSLLAGSEHSLEMFSRFASGQTVEFDEIGGNALEEAGYNVNRDILKAITTSGDYPKISLNNLDKNYGNVYLPLSWIVGDRIFRCLIVVTPNVEVEGAVYAYNGDGEYITCPKDSTIEIDFAQKYGSTTLNNGKTRFSVYKLDDEQNVTDQELSTTMSYYIKSVTVGEEVYTNESQWAKVISFDLTQSQKIKFTTKTNSAIQIVVGLNLIVDGNDRTVIFNEKTYTIVLNQDTRNYVVEILTPTAENGTLSNVGNIYTWNISNVNGGNRNIVIKLRDEIDLTGTEINGILNVAMTQGEGDIGEFSYNNTSDTDEDGTPATTLRLTLNDYISQDKTLTFILYTKYGDLATLNVNLSANASVENKENELNGGGNYNFSDLFTVKLNGSENTDYTITEISFDNGDFVIGDKDNKTITVANLFEDIKNVEMTATLNFGNDENGNEREFTFSQIFTLKSNVELKTTGLPSGDVIAMKELTLNATDFIKQNITDALIECEENENWTISGNSTSTITITPKYVNSKTTLTLNLIIKLPFGEGENIKYSSKSFTFTITVNPAVEMTPNYPNPTDETMLDREYIKADSTFGDILTFFNSKAVYASENRIVVDDKQNTDADAQKLTNENISISITQLQNVIFKVGGTQYSLGAILPTEDNISFARGSSGALSIITFEVTYKGVSKSYTVEVLNEVYSFNTNYQTNNIETGDYGTTAVTYEVLYMDKTNISNLFAEGRMVKIQTKQVITAGEYKFVFSQGFGTSKKYYVSQNVVILPTDGGKLMTYDLGYSMTGKTLEGVYLASDLADSTKFVINNDALTAKSGVETLLESLTNHQTDIFEENIELANRVELLYGGNAVEYNKYEGISENDLTLSTLDLDKIKEYPAISKEDFYSFNYYFKATIDVEVDREATSLQNYISVEVNEEQESIVELFGIRHPTTNNLVSKSEFNENINLSYSLSTDISGLNEKTSDAYSGINFVTDNKYFKIEVGKRNFQNGIYDFAFLPLGAKNDGDFVLTKLTYMANGLSKDFFIVIKILPDYLVTFNDVENGVEDNENNSVILSNSQSAINIETLAILEGETQDYYADFTLLTSNVKDGFLSIKHKNGLNPDNELATNFTITLPVDQNDYNISTNVTSKLMTENSGNWANSTNIYTLIGTSTFTKVPKVVFGEQKYYVDAVDGFDFKVRLYFTLKLVDGSSPTQYSSTAISITEGESVDITARYERLSITAGEEQNGITPLTINSTYVDPVATKNIKLIELSGVEAYGFDKDYTAYLSEKDKGYSTKTGYGIADAQKKYLEVPKIANVTVNKITIKNATTGDELKTITGLSKTTIATAENLIFNGYTPRDVAEMFKMPNLDANIYGTNSTARVIMYVELKYTKDSNIEICTVPVSVEVTRGLNLINGETNVAVDNTAFEVSNIFGFNTSEASSNSGRTQLTYINDTLEVKVEANKNVSFTLTKGGVSKTYSISNVGYSYDKTYYLSISEIMGANVAINDEFTITVTEGNAKFAYLTGDAVNAVNSTNLTFTIDEITYDKISVDNSSLLTRDSYYGQSKHYLVAKANETEKTYYRFTKTYYVTGKYYKMTNYSTQEIDNLLNSTTTEFGTWSANLKGRGLVVDGTNLSMTNDENNPNLNVNNLIFEIDKTEGVKDNIVEIDGDGTITITNSFTNENYVKINIYQKVSGDSSKHYLGSVRLSLK